MCFIIFNTVYMTILTIALTLLVIMINYILELLVYIINIQIIFDLFVFIQKIVTG